MTDIDFQDELDLLSDHQGNRHCVSGKKHDKKSYSCAVRDDLDMVKEEKMTQVLFLCLVSFQFFFFFL